ncbi:MAG TPA: UDP-N-acetylmuramate dehydrogenase [Candidatus Krumholzibacteria bacterium]|nr:UDP-N-acetylmuramate dehydrogenase [Candidatus Krumholzibacteria bacterium]HRX50117.1 UDP-N-acetylmuramate dehydrogenase [Candidatus Krumholzibacteria bacterium]
MHRPSPPDNSADRARLVAEAVADLRRLPWGAEVRAGEALAGLTTFRIGGPAAGVCPVQTPDDARRFLDFAAERGLPTVCLGGGSNVLADDAGFAGLVLLMSGTHVRLESGAVRAGAGLGFDALVERCLQEGRPGLAFASGIPGSVGGAVVGNAGCYGHEIGEFVEEALVLRPDGRLERLGRGDLGFAYRTSRLKTEAGLLLEVTLRLEPADTAAGAAERAEHLADRRRKHPTSEPCAGSYFQNLPPLEPGGRRRAAGMLLDELGARGWREGDAGVFAKHANIIVNLGRATSGDVLRLADRMRGAVRDRHGILLDPEVRHLRPTGFAPAAD